MTQTITRGLAVRHVVASVARIGLVLLALACGWRSSADGPSLPTAECCTEYAGLQVAPAGVTPLVWYSGVNPPPPITDQIAEAVASLYPGRSVTMAAHVRNTGTTSGIPTIRVEDLVGADVLARNLEITITYTSSLAPSRTYTVASGTLAELAAAGAFAAPVKLRPQSRTCAEVGTWTLRVAMPTAAGNETQRQTTQCSLRFGLTGLSVKR